MKLMQDLNKYFQKSILVIRRYGFRRFLKKLQRKIRSSVNSYQLWLKKHRLSEQDLIAQRITVFARKPTISIAVPTYNTPKQFLIDMIESVLNQTYANWELCIADGNSGEPYVRLLLEEYAGKDARIKLIFLPDNKGIAGNSNAALALATGDFIALLDHDDLLAPNALFEVVKVLNNMQDADFIYSDEDKIKEDGRTRLEPHFKPEWSPDTLRSYNYVTHLSVFNRELLAAIGKFRPGFEGSQDYDLILRATERARRIVHIPKVLYHWRISAQSAAGNVRAKMYAYESAKRALQQHLERVGLVGKVEDGLTLSTYRITYEMAGMPKVSIIIPNKDLVDYLKRCITSILIKTRYQNYEIIVAENHSTDQRTFRYYDELSRRGNIRIIEWNKPFNYSAVNNFGARNASGDVLLFLNNDTEVINSDWMERLLEFAVRDDVGAVGAKLYYPDGTIQHGGVILGIGVIAGHSHKYFPGDAPGYISRLQVVQNLSAVTGACLMMRRVMWQKVGGLDEAYPLSLGDVDMCLKLREKGYLIIWTPYAQLYHHESKTRGPFEDTWKKRQRFRQEAGVFRGKWQDVLAKGDPYYNPNLTLEEEDFSLRI